MALNNYQDADFTPSITPSDSRPSMGTYNTPQSFRFWCQKVLPLVYDDSLSYYELLCKVVDYLNNTMEDVNTAVEDVTNLNNAFGSLENHVNTSETALLQAYNDLQGYVNTYFNNLDVQEEINNKLDAMAEDGTLDTILLPYFNEYVATANAHIDSVLNSQNQRINVVESEFNAILDAQTSGDLPSMSEVIAARVGSDGKTYSTLGDAIRGQVTDLDNHIDAMYPLLGSSDFSWVIGKTINASGAVVINVSTAVSEPINVTPDTRLYNYCAATGQNNTATNFLIVEYDINGNFISRKGVQNKAYIDLNSSTYIIRIIFGYLASSGITLTQDDIDDYFNVQIITKAADVNDLRWYLNTNETLIDRTNYSVLLPNLSNVSANVLYRLNFDVNSSNIPLNTPYNTWISEKVVLFATFVKRSGVLNLGDSQIFIASDGIYFREYGNSWSNWELITFGNNSILVQANNYLNILPDVSAVNKNSIYRMNFALNSTNIPANTPYAHGWKSQKMALLQTYVQKDSTLSLGDMQIFIGDDGIYKRIYGVDWQDWLLIASADIKRNFIVDPNGNGDYTSFTEAISVAQNIPDSYVYVKRGTYDAIAEAKALFGDDYFDEWGTTYGPISLRNNIHIYCEPGTILEAHYDGNNDNVMAYYSPINFKWDATLEGLTVKASRVRYAIHDDQWNDTTPYKHYLKNVHLEIDNTDSTWTRKQAFGGGLGVNGYIQFDNCYFKAAGLNGSEYTGYASCSFHNSPSSNAQSKIVMNNCYFADNSGFRFSYYGQSTLISEAFMSGCSMGHAIEIVPESASAQNINVAVIDCNNVVRS